MMVVIGGIASGKRSFLRELGFRDEDMSGSLEGGQAVVLDAQELVRDELDVAAVAEKVARGKRVAAIVEVGSGVVPAERAEREWRERAGSLSRELAARSEVVVRMVCGIPVAVKGDLPESGGTWNW